MGQARTERKRAEKAANREAKIAKKEARVVEDKKRRLGNGWLALMIFGVVALMFAFVWGYNYFSKAASIETYMANEGHADEYANMMISETATMTVTAEKNDMKVVIDVTAEDGTDEAGYYKTDEGVDQMKYFAAYWLGTFKPLTRGSSATATVVANVNGKEFNTVTVDWSEVDKILEKYGMSVDALQEQQAAHEAEHEHEHEHEAEEGAETEEAE